jgi:hypothetical protein
MGRGEIASADQLLSLALAAQRELGYNQGVTWTLLAVARLRRMQRQQARAREVLTECLALAREAGDDVSIAQTLEVFAELLAGDLPETAVQIAAAASTLRKTLAARHPTETRVELEAALASTREQLGEMEWNAAWRAGERFSLEQAGELVRTAPPESKQTRTQSRRRRSS